MSAITQELATSMQCTFAIHACPAGSGTASSHRILSAAKPFLIDWLAAFRLGLIPGPCGRLPLLLPGPSSAAALAASVRELAGGQLAGKAPAGVLGEWGAAGTARGGVRCKPLPLEEVVAPSSEYLQD